jgi:glycine/D-amino acid oxidase-like deaminating enzyme
MDRTPWRGGLLPGSGSIWRGDRIELDAVSVGARPMPSDGTPIIWRTAGVGRLYITPMHAGFAQAPVTGRFAPTEIADAVEVAALSRFRPRGPAMKP